MADAGDRNALWAAAFLDEVARAGVREVCLSPGSRSTPLVLACAADSRFRIFVHLDERSSGFFALGIGKGTRRPALVITTSGTAAANLLPAVVEAGQAEVPLLVATADRPQRLRGADANQVIDQTHLYGAHVRSFFEVASPEIEDGALRHLRALGSRSVALTVGPPAGPVHLNFPFAKPLEPARAGRGAARHTASAGSAAPGASSAVGTIATRGREGKRPFTRIPGSRASVDRDEVDRIAGLLLEARRGLIVAGPASDAGDSGIAARRLARAMGLPLLADPLSGARFGRGTRSTPVVAGYDLFLRQPALRQRMAPDLILRVGATPTSAAAQSLLEEGVEARQIVVDGGGRWKDHLSRAGDYIQAEAPAFLDRLSETLEDRSEGGGNSGEDRLDRGPDARADGWLEEWLEAERRTWEVVERELLGELFEGTVLAAVAAEMEGGESLFVSSSMPVRDLDAFAAPREVDLRVFGNRGASGIDGIVSTALGVAAGGGERVTAVLGDIAFYHDMNGLLATRTQGLSVTFVVIHNDGGGIFNMLPIREYEPEFTPYFATPHGLDFRHVAALYDLPYTKVVDVEELGEALVRERSVGGCGIVEVATDREENRRRHLEVVEGVRQAVSEMGG